MTDRPSLLVINASPRGERSGSRKLAHEFLDSWKAAHPTGTVAVTDLGVNPPPAVSEAWIAGAFSPPTEHSPEIRAAITVSDEYVDQLLEATEIVIAMPIYNFSIPATLKLWIDQVVRIGRTVAIDAHGFQGLAGGRRMKLLVASGTDLRPGQPMADMNFVEPYLRGIFGFIGITQIDFVYAYNQARDDREAILTQALAATRALAAG